MIIGYMFVTLLLLLILGACSKSKKPNSDFIIYSADRNKEKIEMFWKDENSQPLKSIRQLKTYVNAQNKELKFAMNGGMFREHYIPKGLYIENSSILNPIDTLTGKGNFYLEPNGIFYSTASGAYAVVPTKAFRYCSDIQFATQSGPVLVQNGTINPLLHQNSSNINIRNGAGVLENGNPVFVMSKKQVSFYHFAQVFKNLGCRDALYLDGFVSRAYLPAGNWIQEDGDFGVMIGVVGK